jgi:hypothetical protein
MAVVFLGVSAEEMVEKYLFFQCIMVSVRSAVGEFDPMDVVVQTGDSTGALVFL